MASHSSFHSHTNGWMLPRYPRWKQLMVLPKDTGIWTAILSVVGQAAPLPGPEWHEVMLSVCPSGLEVMTGSDWAKASRQSIRELRSRPSTRISSQSLCSLSGTSYQLPRCATKSDQCWNLFSGWNIHECHIHRSLTSKIQAKRMHQNSKCVDTGMRTNHQSMSSILLSGFVPTQPLFGRTRDICRESLRPSKTFRLVFTWTSLASVCERLNVSAKTTFPKGLIKFCFYCILGREVRNNKSRTAKCARDFYKRI